MTTPFLLGCWSNNVEDVTNLLRETEGNETARKALFEEKNEHGWNGVHFATANGHIDLLKQLIEAGAPLSVANAKGWMPIHYAAGYGLIEIFDLLIENGVELDAKNPVNDWTPLHRAIRWGREEPIEHLLKLGADVTAKTRDELSVGQVLKVNAEKVAEILQRYNIPYCMDTSAVQ